MLIKTDVYDYGFRALSRHLLLAYNNPSWRGPDGQAAQLLHQFAMFLIDQDAYNTLRHAHDYCVVMERKERELMQDRHAR